MFNFFRNIFSRHSAGMNEMQQMKENYLNRLIKDDNNVSCSNFFLVVLTIVGVLLLLVPLVVLLIEVWFNHTIATDLNGLAAYIVAVCGVFTVGGATHGWSTWSKHKYEAINQDKNGNKLIDDSNSSSNAAENQDETL